MRRIEEVVRLGRHDRTWHRQHCRSPVLRSNSRSTRSCGFHADYGLTGSVARENIRDAPPSQNLLDHHTLLIFGAPLRQIDLLNGTVLSFTLKQESCPVTAARHPDQTQSPPRRFCTWKRLGGLSLASTCPLNWPVVQCLVWTSITEKASSSAIPVPLFTAR